MKHVYNSIVFLAELLLPIVALFSKKIQLFVSGRKETFAKLTILKNEKTIWFHASSLGEFEQAIPIIEQLKQSHQNHKILVTFFSPSGYEIRKNYPLADVVCYLPLDSNKNAKQFLESVNISVAIFIKYEFWPNFLHQLKQKNVPTILVSGIFREQQVFFKKYGGFMRNSLLSFNHFFVQDENSKNLLNSINFKNITVAGDTRFDRVSKIVNQNNTLDFISDFVDEKFTFVAGSSWAEDEEIIVDYINTKATENDKFIIAPHNINNDAILALQQSINKKTILYSEFNKKISQENGLRQAQSDNNQLHQTEPVEAQSDKNKLRQTEPVEVQSDTKQIRKTEPVEDQSDNNQLRQTELVEVQSDSNQLRQTEPVEVQSNNSLQDYQVFIIDTIGLLTKIYNYADVAYVGGGLKTGLHNILEPATFGIPVIIGNNFDKFKEARDLVKLEGCFSIENKNNFNQIYHRLKTDDTFRKNAGNINKNYINNNIGATEKVLEYLNKIV